MIYGWGLNASSRFGIGSLSPLVERTEILDEVILKYIITGISSNTFIITLSGELYGCGLNTSYQLGLGDTTVRTILTQIGTASNWKKVVCGATQAYGVRDDGTLWSWGSDPSHLGFLGHGTTYTKTTPAQIGSDTDWDDIDCESNHAIAKKTNGTLWSWGSGLSGRLGLGDLIDRNVPTQITIPVVETFSCGTGFNLVVTQSGALYGFGSNYYYTLGFNTSTGDYSSPTQVGSATDWTEVSCGYTHSLVIKSGGSLYSCGNNDYGQLGRTPASNTRDPLGLVSLSGVISAKCGKQIYGRNSFAIASGKLLWSWGEGAYYALGNGLLPNVTSPEVLTTEYEWDYISAGKSCALGIAHSAIFWTNFVGQSEAST